jgi:cytochrome c2
MAQAVRSGVVGFLLAAILASPALGQAPAPPQDAVAGSRVFNTKGCVTCHAVNGIGGRIGPDLGRIHRPGSFYDLARPCGTTCRG